MGYSAEIRPQFASLNFVYDQNTTVHHRQLKDLISCDNDNNFYCIEEKKILQFNTETKKASVVQNLPFSPYCMTVGQGYVAAGGLSSRLAIRTTQYNQSIFVGCLEGAVNNSLHISESAIGSMIFISNNDKTIKLLNLPTMDTLNTLKFPHAVNYSCSTKNNSEYLVSVGDSPWTFVHQVTEDGYRQLSKLKGFEDVGMCCSWDPQGVIYAAASQDGVLCIWDRRDKRVINTFRSLLSLPFRCVKFGPSPMDLLAFSQDAGAVHIVDARNMKYRQILKTDETGERHIAGLAFSPGTLYSKRGHVTDLEAPACTNESTKRKFYEATRDNLEAEIRSRADSMRMRLETMEEVMTKRQRRPEVDFRLEQYVSQSVLNDQDRSDRIRTPLLRPGAESLRRPDAPMFASLVKRKGALIPGYPRLEPQIRTSRASKEGKA